MDLNKLPGKRGQQEGWIPVFPCQAVLLEWRWWWEGNVHGRQPETQTWRFRPKCCSALAAGRGKED